MRDHNKRCAIWFGVGSVAGSIFAGANGWIAIALIGFFVGAGWILGRGKPIDKVIFLEDEKNPFPLFARASCDDRYYMSPAKREYPD